MSGAFASVATGIEVSALRIGLSSLRPGTTAAVSFSSALGSTSESDSSARMPPAEQRQFMASGEAFGSAATATSQGRLAGGMATITGNAFGSGAVVRTSAHAGSSDVDTSAEATIGLVDDVATASFTLAPWTCMTITADVHAFASSTGASPFELADSGFLMEIGDSGGTGLQFARVNFNAFATGAWGAVDDTESAVLGLRYVNDSDTAVEGLFSGYVASFALSGPPVSPISEPGAAAMLALGLLALLAALRPMKKAGRAGLRSGCRRRPEAPRISLPTCR